MNSMLELNCRYDIEIKEVGFGAPLTIGLTRAVFFQTHLLCRLASSSLRVKNLLSPKRQSSGLEVEANLSFED